MTYVYAIPIMLLLAGCATTDSRAQDPKSILSDARTRSLSFCSTVKEGCEFSLSKAKDGWSVWIEPIYHADDGTRVVPFDADQMYFYDRLGTYKSSLRGQ